MVGVVGVVGVGVVGVVVVVVVVVVVAVVGSPPGYPRFNWLRGLRPRTESPLGGVPMDKKTSAIWVGPCVGPWVGPCVTLKTRPSVSNILAQTLKKAPGHVSYFDLLA